MGNESEMTLDNALIDTVARFPFVSQKDIIRRIAGQVSDHMVDRKLRQLRADNLIEYLPYVSGQHLYVPTAIGALKAYYMFQGSGFTNDSSVLASLDKASLRGRLPLVTHLQRVNNLLITLDVALSASESVLSQSLRTGPVIWSLGQFRLILDGQGSIGTTKGQRHFGVVVHDEHLMWDAEGIKPYKCLIDKLDAIAWLHKKAHSMTPLILVVVPDHERLVDLNECAYMPRPCPEGLLWTTTAELEARGPLGAGWMAPANSARKPLLSLVDALVDLSSPEHTPKPYQPIRRIPSPKRDSRLDLVQPITDVRAGKGTVKTPLFLLHASLEPRMLTTLQVIGQHPLLHDRYIQIASACNDRVGSLGDTLNVLNSIERLGLVATRRYPNDQKRRVRYVLTERGRALLAAQAGLSSEKYETVYAVLADNATGDRKGFPRLWKVSLDHTDAIHDAFISILQAIRTRHTTTGTSGLLRWRGEYFCNHPYDKDGQKVYVYPDAEFWYEHQDVHLHAFLELDRGTASQQSGMIMPQAKEPDIAGKIEGYLRYQQKLPQASRSLRPAAITSPLHVLFITVTSNKRGDNILATNTKVAQELGVAPLCVSTVQLSDLQNAHEGFFGRIWRDETNAGLRYVSPALCATQYVATYESI